ncbi:hypothetical protein CYMTET_8757 [Cymbomonas tetramitiformis]|uniref:EF-hand domain-containing protein n=1 Tax=Cymbomonas tetramitiformis TaxID=36881 RepID=A0AAE0LG67_9CHLO|nr:hypothetical protein CYMTET_8757 [Cymbomonas tetramitiformis]
MGTTNNETELMPNSPPEVCVVDEEKLPAAKPGSAGKIARAASTAWVIQKAEKLRNDGTKKNHHALRLVDIMSDLDQSDPDERELARTLSSFDVDGDGTISIVELIKVGERRVTNEKKIANLKKLVIFISLASIAFCGVMLGLMIAANEASKDEKHESDGSLKLLDGTHVSTQNTESRVELKDLPTVDPLELVNMKHMFLKVSETQTRLYTIIGFDWHSDQYMVLHTARGDSIEIENQQVKILLAGDQGEEEVLAPGLRRRSLLSTTDSGHVTIESGQVSAGSGLTTAPTVFYDHDNAVCKQEIDSNPEGNDDATWVRSWRVADLDACKSKCRAHTTPCYGVEYQADTLRCDVMTSRFDNYKRKTGRLCSILTDDPDQGTLRLYGEERVWTEYPNKVCKMAAGTGTENDDGVYYRNTSISSLEVCKSVCEDFGIDCYGIEFYAGDPETGDGQHCDTFSEEYTQYKGKNNRHCLTLAYSDFPPLTKYEDASPPPPPPPPPPQPTPPPPLHRLRLHPLHRRRRGCGRTMQTRCQIQETRYSSCTSMLQLKYST